MQNIEKTIDVLTKELEQLSNSELHELFIFYYKLNHQYENIVVREKFDEFLRSFDNNPFRLNDDKSFRKQLIENFITYTDDHMSLITAAVLIKRKFSIDEIIENYYSNINVYDNNLF